VRFWPVFIGVCRAQAVIPKPYNRCSGTLLPERCRWLSHESGQPDQVVRGATEDEQPVHFLQASQLELAQRAGLLEPSEQQGDILPINIIPMKSRSTIDFIRCARRSFR